MKYRLVEVTKASGFKLWVIQKQFLWWWNFVDGYMDKEKAISTLGKLMNGAPEETRKVIIT